LPDAPALPAVGLPSALLTRRPDLAAAQHRAAAADARIGAALADRFPRFTLGATVGLGGQSPADLVSQWLWSLTAGLAASLIDGGRRSAEVDVRRAEMDASLAALGESALTAVAEVEDALVGLDRARATLAAIDAERAAADALVDETQARYDAGLDDFLPVVTALRGAQQSARAVLGARHAVLSQQIQLYRALGGGYAPGRPRDAQK
ncbi:MAG: TolC family protein, partial [Myxococcales bacterium]|nr:TolC family protein [Myxococcales bacterium]